MPHASLRKAASVVGLGRDSVVSLPVSSEEPWRSDVIALRDRLELGKQNGIASIVVISAGEVNTGRFATTGDEMAEIRELADRYGAWVHVDGGESIISAA